MHRKKRSLVLSLLILLLAPLNGYSASTKATLPVSTTVLYNGCSILASKINFKSDMFGSGPESNGSVVVNCKGGTIYAISLNGAANAAGIGSGTHQTHYMYEKVISNTAAAYPGKYNY